MHYIGKFFLFHSSIRVHFIFTKCELRIPVIGIEDSSFYNGSIHPLSHHASNNSYVSPRSSDGHANIHAYQTRAAAPKQTSLILKFPTFYVVDFLDAISLLSFNLCRYSEILSVFPMSIRLLLFSIQFESVSTIIAIISVDPLLAESQKHRII